MVRPSVQHLRNQRLTSPLLLDWLRRGHTCHPKCRHRFSHWPNGRSTLPHSRLMSAFSETERSHNMVARIDIEIDTKESQLIPPVTGHCVTSNRWGIPHLNQERAELMNTTQKRWIALQVMGVMLAIPSGLIAVVGLSTVNASLVLLQGLRLFLFTTLLAVWWNHG